MKKNVVLISIFALLVIGLLASFFIRGTKPSETADEGTEAPVTPVTIAVGTSGGSRLQVDLIKKLELDKKHGFEFELKPYAAPEIPTIVATKGTEVGYMAPLQAARLNLEGQNIKLLFPIFRPDGCGVLVKSDSDFEEIEDLVGQSVGMSVLTSPTYTFANVAFSLNDYSLEDEFNVTNTSFPTLVPLLENGDVDAVIGLCDETVSSKLFANGVAKQIGNLNQLWQQGVGQDANAYIGAFATTEEWLADHPELAGSIKLAYLDLFEYMADHPELYDLEDVRDRVGIESDEQAEIAKEIARNFHSRPADLDQEQFNQFVELFLQQAVEAGMLEQLPESSLLWQQ